MRKIDCRGINRELAALAAHDRVGFLQDTLPDLRCDDYAAELEVRQPNFIDIASFCVIFDLAV